MNEIPAMHNEDGGGRLVRGVTIFWLLNVAVAALADLLFYFFELLPGEIIRRSFNIGLEESLGTWISTNLTLFVGAVAAAIFFGDFRIASIKDKIGWAVVSLFFLFISFDDAAKFHERVGTQLRVKYESIAGTELDSWFPTWGWQLFVAPLFVLAGCFILYFLWTAIAPHLRKWVLVGFGLFAIAVFADFIEGMDLIQSRRVEHLVRLAEETIEMLGACAFLYVFMVEFNSRFKIDVSRRSTT